MRLTEEQMLDALARMPFADTLELAVTLGEAYSTVHRGLIGLLADGIAARANHGTVHLPTSGRWFLTSEGIEEATDVLGYATPSEFVRAYPVYRAGDRGWMLESSHPLLRKGKAP